MFPEQAHFFKAFSQWIIDLELEGPLDFTFIIHTVLSASSVGGGGRREGENLEFKV